jgi:hypothetical protein
LKGGLAVDALDQDVQALQEWLRKAWRYLAQPAHTRFDRREMRQQMKIVEEKLRLGLQKISARDKAVRTVMSGRPELAPPNWRLLKIDT